MAHGKLIQHKKPLSPKAIEMRRLKENFALTPTQRWKKAFALMEFSQAFKKGFLKKPQGKGIVLRKTAD